jgi:hypothetical protein
MPADPILTLGDLEPERPTVKIRRNAPDGPWQRFKHRHFDVLLRWFPVRYAWTENLYPMRLRSEFGLAAIAKLQRYAEDAKALIPQQDDLAAATRMIHLLREFCALVLIAPQDVIDGLDAEQQVRLVMAFQAAVMGPTPTTPRTENPPTSADSSPASAASTPATSGATG